MLQTRRIEKSQQTRLLHNDSVSRNQFGVVRFEALTNVYLLWRLLTNMHTKFSPNLMLRDSINSLVRIAILFGYV